MEVFGDRRLGEIEGFPKTRTTKIMAKKFNIQIRSSFKELWRYNIAISCGCFTEEGAEPVVVSEQRNIAPVGANLGGAPDGFKLPVEMKLTTPASERIVAYIYIIPHTLPAGRDIDERHPFDLKVKVSADGEVVYNTQHKVNQWSGTSIEIKL